MITKFSKDICQINDIPKNTKRNLVVYLFVVFIVYYVQLLFVKQMDQEHKPTGSSICFFKKSGKVDEKPDKLVSVNEGQAKTKKVVLLFVASVSLFFLSNNNTINPMNLNWVISVCIGAWGFGLFSKMDDLRVSFAVSSIKKQWTPKTWIIIITLGLFVTLFTLYNMYNTFRCDKFKFLLNIGIICLPIIYQIILTQTKKDVKTQTLLIKL